MQVGCSSVGRNGTERSCVCVVAYLDLVSCSLPRRSEQVSFVVVVVLFVSLRVNEIPRKYGNM